MCACECVYVCACVCVCVCVCDFKALIKGKASLLIKVMFKRTQLTPTDPLKRNFKIIKFWGKCLTIDHGFLPF